MPLWLWLVDSLAMIVVLAALVVLALVVRRRMVGRRGRTFDLSINHRPDASPKGWTLGVGTYRANTLDWYRTFSFAWWPRYRFTRGDIRVDGRRDPVGPEVYAIHTGHVVVTLQQRSGQQRSGQQRSGQQRSGQRRSGVQQMALSPSALTGLLAWLESSPPGQRVDNVL